MNLKKGVNLGGFLSQCEHTQQHHETFIQEADIQKVASWGYDHVRLPIDSEVLMTGDEENKKGFEIVDRVIGWCEKANLSIILDLHKVEGYDFNNANDSELNNLFHSEELQGKFLQLWKKIAAHYGEKNSVVAFELLNEVVEKENADAWNNLIDRAVNAIREEAPISKIIYGGISWNSAKSIPMLKKPKDENIIFTFHYYEPLLFTHQKAYWVEAMDPDREIPYTTDMDWFRKESKILGQQGEPVVEAASKTMGVEFHEEMLKVAMDAAKEMNVSLYCGEFGVIDQAPVEDTLRWFEDIGKLFRKYDIGFAIWTYKEKDFGITGPHYAKVLDQIVNAM